MKGRLLWGKGGLDMERGRSSRRRTCWAGPGVAILDPGQGTFKTKISICEKKTAVRRAGKRTICDQPRAKYQIPLAIVVIDQGVLGIRRIKLS